MAEYSYEQVMTALRNADAAGDTEAATRLASIAQGYKQEPKPTSSFSLERGIQDVPRILKDTATGMIGAGEAGLNLGLQLPSMAYAALDKLQEGVDIGLDKLGISPYPEQKGRGEERYVKAMEASNYTPRTELGKENLEVVGKAFNDVGMPLLASGLPVGAALGSGLQAIGKGMTKFNAGKVPRTNAAFEEVLREDAAKASKAATEVVPQKPTIQESTTTGPQMDLFRETPEQIMQRQREQAAGESWGIQRDALGEQGDLFVGQGKEPTQRIVPEDRTPAEIEAAYAQREAQRQADFDTASERMRVQNEPLELEPTQRSQTAPPEDQVPLGQRGFGRGQRGSIDFSFGKKRAEEIIKQEDLEFKKITEELAQHRNAQYARDSLKALEWMKTVSPLSNKVQKLKETLAHEHLPYEISSKLDDAYHDANTLWKNIQTFIYGDPEALHPLGHRLSEDQGRSVAGSRLSDMVRSLPEMEKTFKDYLQAMEEYRRGLNLRSKWDRKIAEEINPILGNIHKLGQTKIGGKQKGSIGFFGKDPFEKFSESIKESYPDATPEQIKRAWDKQQVEQNLPKENRVKQEAIAKAVGNKTNDNLTVYDGADQQSILSAIDSSPDLKDQPGTYQKWFAPKGQIAKELVDNPGVNAGISRIKHITDSFARKSETELFGPNGIITKITKFESPFGPGKISNLFKERFKAKNNPEYKQQLNKFEAELDTAIDELVSKNFEEVSKVFEQNGKEPPKNIYKYFPSLFDGKFVFEVKTAGGKPVLMTAHNKNQYNLMRDLMQAEGLEVGHIRERKALQNRFGDTEHLVAEYQMMLDFMDSSMPEAVAVRNAMEGIEQANAATTAGYQNRFKEYSGYKGNLGNNPFLSDSRNFYDAKKALTRYQEAHNAWLAAHELTTFDKELGNLSNAPSGVTNYLSSQIQDIVVKQRANDLVTPLMDVVQSITGVSDSAQMRAVRQYANLNTVRMVGAGSFRALTQNFFQPIEAILPKFLQMYPKVGGGALDIVSPAVQGLGDYFQVLGIHNKNEIGGLLNSMQSKKVLETESKIFGVTSNELYREAVKSGLIDPTVLESTPFLDRKLTQGAWKFGSGLLSRSSEQAARFATFSTFSRWLIDAGIPKEKAILQAKQWTEGHMVDYSVEAKPSIMTNTGILGEAAGRLQTYKATQIGRYVVYIKEMMKSGNTKPLAAMLTVNLMLAGLQGMIGMDVVSTVMDGLSTISTNPKDKEFSFRRFVSEKVPEWANWGLLSTTTNLGLFNAFSQQSIGDGSLANMFPVYSGVVEQGRTVARRMTKDWNSENVGEQGRQIASFMPSTGQPWVDRNYLTQYPLGKKTAISKFTNNPVYEYQEGDYSLGNIMPFERAKQSTLRNEMSKEGTRFNTGKKDLEKQIEAKVIDIYAYGHKNAFNEKALNNMITDLTKGYKGDPQMLDKAFTNMAIKSGMSKKELVRLLQMNKIDYEQLPEINRMLKYSNLMEKQNGR